MALVKPDLGDALPLVASGKVRELYNVDSKSLLFVASDRISAYDVIMKNVRRDHYTLSPLHRQLTNSDSTYRVFQTKGSSSLF